MKKYVKSHFLDSGAFSLFSIAQKYQKENNCDVWDFYNTKEFWKYINDYAKFIKKYKIAIDLYANLDAIPNPELTWRNQQYLEKKHGLSPVPVVHFGTDLKWLKHYMDRGYELIGLGGLVGNIRRKECVQFLHQCFDMVCDTPNRLPKVKIHGFGVSSFSVLVKYPWWSVDFATWDKAASYGGVYVPYKHKGKYIFNERPYVMKISIESPEAKRKDGHLTNLSPMANKIVRGWLDFINIPYGKMDEKKENVLEKGAYTFHLYRRIANLHYFQLLSENLPEWPTPFDKHPQETLEGIS